MSFRIGDYCFDFQNAKDLHLIPPDCVDSISCVRFGEDRIAFGSSNMSAVIHTRLSAPNPQRFELATDGAEIVSIEWNRWCARLLLVATRDRIVVIDSDANAAAAELSPPNARTGFVCALWHADGLIGLLERSAVEIWDTAYALRSQLSVDGCCRCAALDGDVLYVGMDRVVRRYRVDGHALRDLGAIAATPARVDRVQVTERWLLTSDRSGVTAWHRDALVPAFLVKAEGIGLVADPIGALALSVAPGKRACAVPVAAGKFSALQRALPVETSVESSRISADWGSSAGGGSLLCAVAFEKSDEFCYAVIGTVTRGGA